MNFHEPSIVSHELSISRVGPVSHGSSISRASISRTQYLTDPVSHGPTVSHHSISRHSSISRQYLTLPGSQLFFKISQLFSNSEISQKARISACLTRISRRMETCPPQAPKKITILQSFPPLKMHFGDLKSKKSACGGLSKGDFILFNAPENASQINYIIY